MATWLDLLKMKIGGQEPSAERSNPRPPPSASKWLKKKGTGTTHTPHKRTNIKYNNIIMEKE